jgi:hypothetical protein
MTLQSKRELIQVIDRVYRKSSKEQKSHRLDHSGVPHELTPNCLTRLLLIRHRERPSLMT